MLKNILIAGVVVLGLGLTSPLTAQHSKEESSTKTSPKVVGSVVFKKKDINEIYPALEKPKKAVEHDEVIRAIDETEKQRIEEHKQFLRNQFIRAEKARLERERIERERQARIAEEKRQRELAKARALAYEKKLREERERRTREQNARTSSPPSPPTTQSSQGSLNMEFTYYIAMCDTGCTGVTATGIDVRNTIYYQGMRIIATDPSVIPTWSIVQFEMGGQMVKAIALDTGGAIKGNRIDMLVGSINEANRLGRGVKRVEILRYGK
ncbi:3D domain-containing protein [Pseudobacillus badius]|uniref:3D domain-containing protein n=1 Tax=Bacillus badius TaxID=1455 RepID=UPI0007B32E15|nr:3D domain-containing protein [Bacillus badius]KZR57923.1 hypothetical protein A3781_19290 [Bacillus badius]